MQLQENSVVRTVVGGALILFSVMLGETSVLSACFQPINNGTCGTNQHGPTITCTCDNPPCLCQYGSSGPQWLDPCFTHLPVR